MHIVLELFQAIGLDLAMLLPIINPVTAVAIFLGLSHGMTSKQVKLEIIKVAIYTFLIMMTAYYAGQVIMAAFGVSIPALRITAGLIIVFIGFQMLFPNKEMDHSITPKTVDDMQTNNKASIAFIPMTMPCIAGPGTISLIINSAATAATQSQLTPITLMLAPTFTFLAIAIIMWICLRSANAITCWIGKGGMEAISRLMGFILACIGIQFIINGILELITSYH